MKEDIKQFIAYLETEKGASANTCVSYRRDLMQMTAYFEEMGITEIGKVTKTALTSYVLHLEKQGKKTTTISRMLASIKALFHYEFKQGRIKKDPAEEIRPPKVEKKAPRILSVDEVSRLLAQPSGNTAKEIRDRAMLELLYATGMRVSELLDLEISNLNLKTGIIICQCGKRSRAIPFRFISHSS